MPSCAAAARNAPAAHVIAGLAERGGECLRGAFACRSRFVAFRGPAGTGFTAGAENPEGLPLRIESDSRLAISER